MPRKKDAKVLGRCGCPSCGETMAVLQNTKDYLYTQCPSCGCDQRNGAKHQTDIWNRTEWIDGEPEKRPRNYIEASPESEPVQVQEPESEPVEPKKPQEKQSSKKSGGLAFLLVPAGILLALGLRG